MCIVKGVGICFAERSGGNRYGRENASAGLYLEGTQQIWRKRELSMQTRMMRRRMRARVGSCEEARPFSTVKKALMLSVKMQIAENLLSEAWRKP